MDGQAVSFGKTVPVSTVAALKKFKNENCLHHIIFFGCGTLNCPILSPPEVY